MPILLNSILLIFLFGVLGLAADFAVRNIKYIAGVLKVRLFAFGIMLGLITTLPELSVGINAMLDNASSLSAGNLLGGIMVILGLILGVSLIFNREVHTDGRFKILIPEVLVIFSPVLLGLDGRFGLWDGVIMVGLYLGLIYYLYRLNHSFEPPQFKLFYERNIIKAVMLSTFGVIFILLASHWIVQTTLKLMESFTVSKLAVGLIVFAIGTNLPEITIAFTSWRKKSSELSLSHLLSSAFTNVLILGVLAMIRPIGFTIGQSYWVVAFFIGLLLVLFLIFARSGRKMDRREGLALLGVYIFFLVVNFFIGR